MRDGWHRGVLSDVAEVTIGRQRSPRNATGPHMTRYLRSANVKDGRLELSDVLEMNFSPAEQEQFRLRPGDVLVSEGSASHSQVGASAVWAGELDGLVCFQNTLLRLRARPDMTMPEYLGIWARHAHRSGAFAAIAGGSSILHIGSERAKRMPVHWPTLAEQRRVSDVAAALDAAIAAARRVAGAADLARLAIEEGACIVLGSAPTVRLDEIAEVVGGVTKDSKRRTADMVPVPYLRVANVHRGRLRLEDTARINVSVAVAERLRLQPGDILMNEGGDRDKLGRGWVWEGQLPDCIHQNHVFRARLRPGAQYDPKFVSMWANTFGSRWFFENGGQTSGIASIGINKVRSFPVPDVPLEDQLRLTALTDDVRVVHERAAAQVEAATSLALITVEQMLTGQHTVPSSYDALLADVS